MEQIQNTKLYRSLAEGRKDVQVWEENFTEGGYAFFSIVTFEKGEVTILAQLRSKEGVLERQTRDVQGAEQWVAVE